MIVKNTSRGWEIVTQTAHAFLASQIADELSDKFKNKYWLETVLAVYNHETLETDFNSGSVLNNKGMPLDFRESKATESQVLKKIETMIRTIVYRSSIANALITRHLKFLHPDIFNNNKARYEKIIDDVCKRFNIVKPVFEKMYGVLQFTDRLSLIICFDELPETNRKIEINDSLNGNSISVTNLNEKFIVEPWPFESKKISVYKEYRVMKSAFFNTEKAFLKEYHNMKIETITYDFFAE
jgi:hypothetical protein